MRLIVIAALLIASGAFATSGKNKTSCTSRELRAQDCRLSSGSYTVRLLPDTIAWHDGTWHTVDPMPLKGEGTAWEKIHFELLSGRPVLQLWVWDKGEGEASVQSLHWYVADAEKRKLTILAEGVVRRRRLKQGLADAPAEGKPAPPPKYIYENMEKHGLKTVKGELEWSLGREKKHLEKVKDGV